MSGLLGFLRLVVAAAAAQFVALPTGHSPVPLAATLLGLSLVMLLALRAIGQRAAQVGLLPPSGEPEPIR